MPPHFGAVAQLGERCVRNAEVEGSTPFRSTEKALFANPANKAFSLGFVRFASLAGRVIRPSSFSDRRTANDPECFNLPASGELFGEFTEGEKSRQSVPVARIEVRSIGEALRLSAGNESSAPHTSKSFGSV